MQLQEEIRSGILSNFRQIPLHDLMFFSLKRNAFQKNGTILADSPPCRENFLFQKLVRISFCRKRAEYGFSEYGFKHRTQWVFWLSPSSGERAQWVSSRPLVCVPERTHRVLRRTHPSLPSKTQWGSVSSLLRNSTLETVFRPFPILLMPN